MVGSDPTHVCARCQLAGSDPAPFPFIQTRLRHGRPRCAARAAGSDPAVVCGTIPFTFYPYLCWGIHCPSGQSENTVCKCPRASSVFAGPKSRLACRVCCGRRCGRSGTCRPWSTSRSCRTNMGSTRPCLCLPCRPCLCLSCRPYLLQQRQLRRLSALAGCRRLACRAGVPTRPLFAKPSRRWHGHRSGACTTPSSKSCRVA